MLVDIDMKSFVRSVARIKTLLLLAVMCLPMLAPAQLQSLDSTQDGRGTLDWRTRVSANTIRRVRVLLHSNHRADITVLSGASERFSGRWKSGGLTTVYVNIDRVGNDPAIGSAQIVHARGEFVTIFSTGSVGTRKFELKFESDNAVGGGGGGGGARSLDIVYPQEDSVVDSSSVNIQGTSRARNVNVKIYNDNRRLIANRNVDVRNDRWSMRVNLERGRYRVVANDSRSRGDDEVSFRVGRRSEIDEKVFKDNAKDAIRDRFRGYEVSFKETSVSREVFDSRTVRGDFHVSGRGDRRGDYRMTVVCDASNGRVRTANYSRR